jgi:hypothetical protein
MIPIPSGTGHTDMRRGMQTWLLRFRSPSGAIPTPGDLYIFRAAAATSLKSFGVAARVFRSMSSAWIVESSSALRHPTVLYPSPRRRWPICSRHRLSTTDLAAAARGLRAGTRATLAIPQGVNQRSNGGRRRTHPTGTRGSSVVTAAATREALAHVRTAFQVSA